MKFDNCTFRMPMVLYDDNYHLRIAAIWVSGSIPHEFIRREIKSKLRLTDAVQCVFECHRSLMPPEEIHRSTLQTE